MNDLVLAALVSGSGCATDSSDDAADDAHDGATSVATGAASDGAGASEADDGGPSGGSQGDGSSPTTGEASGDGADSTGAAVDDDTGGAPTDAAGVYAQSCAMCHGDAAQGNDVGTDIGPEIRHPHPVVATYAIRHGDQNTIVNAQGEVVGHPGIMRPFAAQAISDEMVDELVAWLWDYPQPTTGAELFADYCSYCHGTTGGTDTEYVSAYHNLPFTTSGAVATLPAFITYVRGGHEVDDQGVAVPQSDKREFMPAFGPELLTDEELTLIEAWARQQ